MLHSRRIVRVALAVGPNYSIAINWICRSLASTADIPVIHGTFPAHSIAT
jgi:hypothetical protein